MMYSYPFFSFPHFRGYSSYYPMQYPYARQLAKNRQTDRPSSDVAKGKNQRQDLNKTIKSNEKTNLREGVSSKRTPPGFSFLNNIFHQEDRGDDEEYFDLLGIKLYHDDLLLIGLIFFLYKEDVKDQYLFFALVLLLLS